MNFETEKTQPNSLRAICIARHPFLTGHFSRYFATLGVRTSEMVGLSYSPTMGDDGAAQQAMDIVHLLSHQSKGDYTPI